MIINTCLRCGHNWEQRKDGRPVCCPVCKSPKWDVDRITCNVGLSTMIEPAEKNFVDKKG